MWELEADQSLWKQMCSYFRSYFPGWRFTQSVSNFLLLKGLNNCELMSNDEVQVDYTQKHKIGLGRSSFAF